jgi:hypothetical protein
MHVFIVCIEYDSLFPCAINRETETFEATRLNSDKLLTNYDFTSM